MEVLEIVVFDEADRCRPALSQCPRICCEMMQHDEMMNHLKALGNGLPARMLGGALTRQQLQVEVSPEFFTLARLSQTSCGVRCNVLFFQVLKRCAKGCQRGFLAKTGATPEIQ